jgi:hypothetical protein
VELLAGMEAALSHDMHTVPGRSYKLEFSVGDDGNGCMASMAVQAYTTTGSVRVPYQL